jgi:hypothetical protein
LRADAEIIFYGDGADVLSRPRGETENRLLEPRR